MNISKQTIQQLKTEGFDVQFYKDFWDNDESSPEEATQLFLYRNDENGNIDVMEHLKTPKKKEVTVDWIYHKLFKESTFINLTEKVKQLLPERDFAVYPTSYGIGVHVIMASHAKAKIQQVYDLLNEHQLQFTTEYSDAHWVYRFKLSKSAENIEKIQALKP